MSAKTPSFLQMNMYRMFSSGFRQSGIAKFIIYFNVLVQLTFPLAIAFTPAVAAQSKTHEQQIEQSRLTEKRAAEIATRLGKDPSSQTLTDMGRELATQKANEEISQWMNQFGNARVKLNVDKNFSLKDSRVDVLLPWWENKEHLIFTQNSLHRSDKRVQTNAGLGWRYSQPDYMLGLNTFLDHDFTGNHTRAGVGVEYWRDYLKLNANGYFRLSDWKDAKGLEDYEARPANGWDVMAEGYLPAYPQLGAKLGYEQYYGDSVALFGKDKRHKNSHAVTAGLSYTPFPLLTLDVTHREGDSSDTKVGLQLNYQLGSSLSSQLDSDAVAQKRSLIGSRYDLVERNNNIVLDYRKKEVIRLVLADSIIGYEGEQKPLAVSVNSKYGLDHIEWDDSTITAKGGKIVNDQSGQYSVVLPAFQPGTQQDNSYIVGAVAYDKKGNASTRVETVIIVQSAAVNQTNSLLEPKHSSIPADGKSTQQLILTLKDKDNQPIDAGLDEIGVNMKSNVNGDGGKLLPITKIQPGQYQITVIAASTPQTAVVTPIVRGELLNSATVSMVIDNIDTTQSKFDVSPTEITANNQESSTLTFSAKDNNGQPVTGLKNLQFAVAGENSESITVSKIVEQEGNYTATLIGSSAGIITVTPQVGDSSLLELSRKITLTDSPVREANSSFQVSKSQIMADNQDSSTLTFIARDQNNQPVTGLEDIKFIVVGEVKEGAAVSVIMEHDGVYTATLSGNQPGQITVFPQVEGRSFEGLSQTITLVDNGQSIDVTKSSLTLSKDTLVADDKDFVVMSFTARNSQGQLLTGLEGVTIMVTRHDAASNVRVLATEEKDGVYSAELIGRAAGQLTVLPKIKGVQYHDLAKPLTIVPGSVNIIHSSFQENPPVITADNQSESELTFEPKDTNNNPITGLEDVTFVVSGLNNKGVDVSETVENDGVYTAKLKGSQIGTGLVTPKIGDGVLARLSRAITLIPSVIDSERSSFSASKYEIKADNTEQTILSLTAKDAEGNLIADLEGVSFKVKGESDSGIQIGKTSESKGVYTASLQGTRVGSITVVPTIMGTEVASLSVQITLTVGELSASKSTFTASKSEITADNRDESVLTFRAKDEFDNLLTGLDALTFDVSGTNEQGVTVSKITEQEEGVYSATLKGDKAGMVTVVPKLKGTPIGSLQVQIQLMAGVVEGGNSSFSVSKQEIIADNKDYSELRFSVKDGNDNPITNLKNVTFSVTGLEEGSFTLSPTVADNGVYSATLRGKKVGTATVEPHIAGTPIAGIESQQISLLVGEIEGSTSEFSVSKNEIVADNSDTSELSFAIKDAYNNPIIGLSGVSFKVTGLDKSSITVSDTIENNGVYSATLKGSQTGTVSVVPQIDGSDVTGVSTQQIRLVAGAIEEGNSEFSVSKNEIIADNNDTSVLRFTIQDAHNNPVTGLSGVTFNVTGLDNESITVSETVEDNGVYSATLKGIQIGTVSVLPQIDGSDVAGVSAQQIRLVAGAVEGGSSEFSVSKTEIIADNSDSSVLTFSAKDAHNNPITGLKNVGFKVTGLDKESITVSETVEDNGVYTATLTGTQAGSISVAPMVNNSAVSGVTAQQILLKAGSVAGDHSEFTVSKTEIVANDRDQSVLSFSVKDSNNNPITDLQDVTFSVTGLEEGSFTVSATTADNGVYSATLQGKKVGTATVEPRIAGAPVKEIKSQQISLIVGEVEGSTSEFSVSKNEIVADNSDTSELSFTIKDAYNNPIIGLSGVTFKVTGLDKSSITVSETIENNGIYSATLKGNQTGTVSVVPQIDGSNVTGVSAQQIRLIAGAVEGGSSEFSVSKNEIVADNSDESVLTFSIKDAYNNPVTGLSGVTFKVTGLDKSSVTVSETVEDNGVYSAALKGVQAGTVSVLPQIDGSDVAGVSAQQIRLVAGAVEGGSSEFSVSKTEIIADNSDASVLTFSAKDAHNNPITGLSGVTFNITGPNKESITVSETVEDNGVYTATLTGTQAGSISVVPMVDNSAVSGVTAQQILLKAGSVAGEHSEFTVSKTEIVANDRDQSVLRFSVKDSNNNPITDLQDVTFSVTGLEEGSFTVSATEADNGVYSATLRGKKAGTATVEPHIAAAPVAGINAQQIRLLAGDVEGGSSEFSVSKDEIVADNSDESVLTFSIKDANSNPITGLSGVTFKVTGLDKSSITVSDTVENNGVYSATLKGNQTGTVSVLPQIEGSDVEGVSAQQIRLIAGAVEGGSSSFTVSKNEIIADNSDESVLTFSIKDAYNNPVTGLSGVTFNVTGLDNESITVSETVENNGVYSAKLKGSQTGTVSVVPQIEGSDVEGVSAQQIRLIADEVEGGSSSFTVSKNEIIADNSDASVLTFSAKDAHDNPITGLSGVTFNITGPNKESITVSETVEDNGVYTATLTGTQAGSISVLPMVDNSAVSGVTAQQILLKAGSVAGDHSEFTVSKTEIVANDRDQSVLRFSVKDSNNNPITDLQDVTFSVTGLEEGSFTVSATEADNGVYSATLQGKKAGTATVEPNIAAAPVAGINAQQIRLLAGDVEGGSSEFSVSKDEIVADNSDESVLTFSIKDANSNPITGLSSVTFNVTGLDNESITVSETIENNGVYSAKLKGIQIGIVSVVPQIEGSDVEGVSAQQIRLIAGAVEGGSSEFSVSKDEIVADNSDESVLTFSIKDAYNNPVTGLSGVTFNVTGLDNESITVSETVEDNGVYSATLKGIQAGTVSVVPQIEGSDVEGVSAQQIRLVAGAVEGGSSEFSVSKTEIIADNSDASVLTFSAKDAHDNPITGLSGVTFNITGPNKESITVSETVEDNGVYTATLTGTQAGSISVVPMVDNSAVSGVTAQQILLKAGSVAGDHSEFTVSKTEIVANDRDQSVLRFSVKDSNNNPITDLQDVTFSVTGLEEGSFTVSATTADNGIYSATLRGKKVGTATVEPRIAAAPVAGINTQQIRLLAGDVEGGSSEFSVSKDEIVADNSDESVLTFSIKDANSNPITGLSNVTFKVTGLDKSSITVSDTVENNGVYSATLKGNQTGTVSVLPQIEGSDVEGVSAQQIRLIAGAVEGGSSSFTVSKNEIIADNSDESVLTFSIKDAHNNPVTGLSGVTFNVTGLDNESITVSETVENNGVYSAKLKGSQTGTVSVVPQIEGSDVEGVSAQQIRLIADEVEGGSSSFTVSKNEIIADNSDASVLTFSAKDAHDNPITGLSGVTFNITGPTKESITVSETVEDNGVYTATLTGTQAGSISVLPMVDNSAVSGVTAQQILLKAGSVAGDRSEFTVSKTEIVANDRDQSVLRFSVNDSNNNPITDLQDVTFSVTGLEEGSFTVSATEADNGVYSATLQGKKAGTATVEPNIAGAPVAGINAQQIRLLAGDVEGGSSEFSVSKDEIVADNSDESVLTFSIKDANSNPITGLSSVTFNVTGLDKESITVSETVENNGVYSAKLKGIQIGTVSVVPQIEGSDVEGVSAQQIRLIAGAVEGGSSEFSVSKDEIVADNSDESVLTFSIKDAYNNPVTGLSDVTFNVTGLDKESITVSETVEDNGVYSAKLKGSQTGTVSVVPQIEGSDVEGVSAQQIRLVAGAVEGGSSEFSVSKTEIIADNSDASVLTFSAKDAHDNPITGLSGVTFNITGPNKESITVSETVEDNGVYTATLTGTQAGSISVVPMVDNSAVSGVTAQQILLKAGSVAGDHSEFTVSKTEIVANDRDQSVLRFSVKDSNNNPITDLQDVTFSVTGLEEGSFTVSATEADNGVYSAALQGNKVGTATVEPHIAGAPVKEIKSQQVSLIAGQVDVNKSTFTASKYEIIADNADSSQLLFTAKDGLGNPVTGLSNVTFAVNGLDESVITLTPITEESGVYSATLTGRKAGQITIVPQIDGKNSYQLSLQIQLKAGEIEGNNSSFTASTTELIANDSDEALLILTIKDQYNNPITGLQDVNFQITGSSASGAKISETEENEGVYTARLKGSKVGKVTVTAQVGSVPVKDVSSLEIQFKAGEIDGVKSDFTVSKDEIVADNSDESVLTFTAKDSHSNLITGLQGVSFKVSGLVEESYTVSEVTENEGVYTATFKGKKVGTATIVPQIGEVSLVGIKAQQITLTVGEVAGANSTFTVSKNKIIADNSDESVLTFIVNDRFDNPVTGLVDVTFAVEGMNEKAFSVSEVTEDNGVYSATFKGDRAGVVTIQPKIAGELVAGVEAQQISLVAGDIEGNKSTFSVSKTVVTADNSDASILTFTAKDGNNNPITDLKDVTFKVTGLADGAFNVSKTVENSGVYRATLTGNKTGTVTIVPHLQGNPVEGIVAQKVQFIAGEVVGANSSFTVSKNEIVADNSDESILTFTAQDSLGNPVTGLQQLAFNVTGIEESSLTVSNIKEKQGVYTATLKGTKAGTVTVSPQLNDVVIEDVTAQQIKLKAGDVDGGHSSFTVSKNEIVADNSDESVLTFTAQDSYGNPVVALQDVTFALSGLDESTITVSDITEQQGVYTATLKGNKAGMVTIAPHVKGKPIGELSAQIQLTAGELAGDKSSFTVSKSQIIADNSDESVLTFTAQDSHGNPVTELSELSFQVSGLTEGSYTLSEIVADNGVYTATLKGSQVGTATVLPKLDDQEIADITARQIQLVADELAGDKSSFTVSKDEIVADNSDTSVLTFTAKDSHNNPISGLKNLSFKVTGLPDSAISVGAISEENGVYTATLMGSKTGTVSVEPQLDQQPVTGVEAQKIRLIAGEIAGGKSSFTVSKNEIVADNSDESVLTFTAQDSLGNPVTGLQQLAFNVTGVEESSLTVSDIEEENGVYTASLKGTKAGTVTVSPQLNDVVIEDVTAQQIKLKAGDVDGGHSSFTVSKTAIVADESDESVLTFTAQDSNGNPVVALQDVTFALSGLDESTVTVSDITEQQGVYTATLKGNKAGTVTIAPQVKGEPVGELSAQIQLTAGELAGDKSSFTVSKAKIIADNSDESVLTFTAQDSHGNPITELPTLSFQVSGLNEEGYTLSEIVADNGVYTATLKGSQVGTATVLPKLDDQEIADITARQIQLVADELAGDKSSFTVSKDEIVADNSDTSVLTFTAKDSHNNPISGLKNLSFKVTGLPDSAISVGAISEENGVYTATLMGSKTGTVSIEPQLDQQPVTGVEAQKIRLIAGEIAGGKSSFTVSKNEIVADNSDESILTFTAQDSLGNPVTGLQQLAFNVTGVEESSLTVSDIEEENGVYTASLKGTKAGTVTVSPQLNDVVIEDVTAQQIKLKAGDIDGGHSSFTVSKTAIVADESDESVLTFTAQDSNGNPVVELQDVTFALSGLDESTITVSDITEQQGVYTATLKGNKAGTVTVAPQVKGKPVGELSAQIQLTAGELAGDKSSFTVSKAKIIADNSDESVLTFTAQDSHGNPVTELSELSFQVSGLTEGSYTLSEIVADNGVYTATLKGSQVGTATVLPKLDDQEIADITARQIQLVADELAGDKSSFTVSKDEIVADNSDTSVLTFTAKDSHNNPISGLKNLSFKVTGLPDSAISVGAISEENGVYTATLMGSKTGTVSVEPLLDQQPVTGVEAQKIRLIAGEIAGGKSSFTVSKNEIVADNSDESILTFTAQDSLGNPVTGLQQLAFNVTGVEESSLTVSDIEEENGVYTASLKGIKAGTVTVSPQLNDVVIEDVTAQQIKLKAGNADGEHSSFTVSKNKIVADESDESVLTFTAQDSNGNPVVELQDVTFALSGLDKSTVTVSDITEQQGVYTATLKGNKAGTVTIAPQVKGKPVGELSAQIQLIAGELAGDKSSFTVSKAKIIADNSDESVLTFTAQDSHGNPVTELSELSFQVSGLTEGSYTLSEIVADNGVYTATLKGSQVGTATVLPKLDDQEIADITAQQIQLVAGELAGDKSSFTVSKDEIVADNSDTSVLTFTAKDGYNNPISGLTNLSFKATGLPDGAISVGAISEENGVYTATLMGSKTGTVSVEPQLDQQPVTGVDAQQIRLIAGEIAGGKSSFTVSKNEIIADNSDESVLTFTAQDSLGNPVTGLQQLAFNVTGVEESSLTVSDIEEENGVYTASLKGTKVGTVTVSPQLNGSVIGDVTAQQIKLKAGNADGEHSSFTVSKNKIVADNSDESVLTFTAQDSYGNPVVELQDVTFALSGLDESTITVSDITEQQGVYTATLKGNKAGTVTIAPQVKGKPVGELSAQIQLTAGELAGDKSSFTVSKAKIIADNSDESVLTFTAQDSHGNPVTELSELSFQVSGLTEGSYTLSEIVADNGVYTATLKGSQVGTATVLPKLDDQEIADITAQQIQLVAGELVGDKSSFTVSKNEIVADNSDTSVLTFTAKDGYNNPISGLKNLSFKATGLPDSAISVGAISEENGVYTATLMGSKTGIVSVEPQLDQQPVTGVEAQQIRLIAGEIAGTNSSFTVSKNEIVADDSDESVLTFTVQDSHNNAVSGLKEVTFKVTGLEDGEFTVSATAEERDGVYSAKLTGSVAGTATVLPLVAGEEITGIAAQQIKLISDEMSSDKSTFHALKYEVIADGKDSSILIFAAKDSRGNPVIGLQGVTFAVSGIGNSGVTISPTTEERGVYTATLTASKIGAVTVVPQVKGQPVDGLSVQIKLVAGELAGDHSSFEVSKSKIVADNSDESVLTFTAQDSYGNPITELPGLSFQVSGLNEGSYTLSDIAADNGVYTATLKGSQIGTATVLPKVKDQEIEGINAQQIQLVAGELAGDKSSFTVSKNEIVADNSDTSVLTFTAKDSHNNPISGLKKLSFKAPGLPESAISISEISEENGVYTATLMGNKTGSVTVEPQLDQQSITGVSAQQIRLIAGEIVGNNSSFTVSKDEIIADNSDESVLTFSAKDSHNNAVSGLKEVTFKVTGLEDEEFTVSATAEEQDGVYSAKLTGSHAGIATVMPLVAGAEIAGIAAQQIELISDGVSGEKSTFHALKYEIVADDKDSSILIFAAKDSRGNPVTDLHNVTFAVKGVEASGVTISPVTEESGVYTATLTARKTGTVTINPLLDGAPVGELNVRIKLKAGEIEASKSAFTVSKPKIDADNIEETVLSLSVKDSLGNPVTGLTNVSFKVEGEGFNPGDTTVSLTVEAMGVYRANLKGKKVGIVTVTPLIAGEPVVGITERQVEFVPGPVSGLNSMFEVTKHEIIANNKDESELIFTARDNGGNLITDLYVTFLAVGEAENVTIGTTVAENGVYRATLKGGTAGTIAVYPLIKGAPIQWIHPQEIVMKPDDLISSKSTFEVSKEAIVANFEETTTLIFTARDDEDKPVTGLHKVLSFKVEGDIQQSEYQVSSVIEKGEGVYQAELKGMKVISVVVRPMVRSEPIEGVEPKIVKMTVGEISGNQSQFEVTRHQIIADGRFESLLRLKAIDSYGNFIEDLIPRITYQIEGMDDGYTIGAITYKGKAWYEASFKGTKPGKVMVTVLIDGQPVQWLISREIELLPATSFDTDKGEKNN